MARKELEQGPGSQPTAKPAQPFTLHAPYHSLMLRSTGPN